jgi:hypothetical protein
MDTTIHDERGAAAGAISALRSLGYGLADELTDGFAALTLVDVVTTRFVSATAGVAVCVRAHGGRLEVALLRASRTGWVRTPTAETAEPDGVKGAIISVIGEYFRSIEAARASHAASRAA